jgi:hypothetical protein
VLGVGGVEVHAVTGGVGEGQQIAGPRQPGQEDHPARDQVGLQAQVAHEIDPHGFLPALLDGHDRARSRSWDEDGIDEDAVLLQADVAGVHAQAHQVVTILRAAHVHDPGQRQPALVHQRPPGLGPQVVQVLQEEAGERAAQCRARE